VFSLSSVFDDGIIVSLLESFTFPLRRGSSLRYKGHPAVIYPPSQHVSRTNLRREGRVLEVYADNIKFSGVVVFFRLRSKRKFFSTQVIFTTTNVLPTGFCFLSVIS